jgi:tetratricopeptide (TPR) repeat protein
MLTTAAFAGVLLAATMVSALQAFRATRAETAARESERQARDDRAVAETQKQVAEQREAEARENERKARAAEAAATESDATAKDVLRFVREEVFAAANPRFAPTLGRDITLRQALDAAEPKIRTAFAKRPRVEIQLRYVLAETYAGMGEYQLALSQFELAFDLAKTHLGPDNPQTVLSELSLCSFYVSLGRTKEAFTIVEQALVRRRQTLGPDAPNTIATLSWLVETYSRQSSATGVARPEHAKKLTEELLAVRSKAGRVEELKPGELVNLTYAYSEAGRQAESDELMERLLPGLCEKYGMDDTNVMAMTLNLAIHYYLSGRTAEAVAILEPVYRAGVASHGYGHPTCLNLLQSLSAYLDDLGRYTDTVLLVEAALPELQKTYGPGNPHISPLLINLCSAYNRLGKPRQVVSLVEATVAAIPKPERSAYVNYTFLLGNLAWAYHELDDFPRLRRVVADTEEWVRGRYPAGSLELATSLSKLALDYHAVFDPVVIRAAERLARESLAIREQKLPGGWQTFNSKSLLGSALLRQGRYAEAEPLLAAGYEGLKARRDTIPPLGWWNRPRAGWWLALLYERTGRPERGAAVRAELGAETLPPPRAVNQVASPKHHVEAIKQVEETLAAQRVITMHHLAASYIAQNRHAEALKLREEILDAQRRMLPNDHPDTLWSEINLAESYMALNRHAEALPLLNEALAMADRPGIDRRFIRQAITLLEQCCKGLGDVAVCRASAELWEKRDPTDAVDIYDATCCRAITASLQAKAKGPDAARLAKEDADKAMAWLQKAVAAGWKDAAHMKADTALDFLRDREDFKKLMAELEKQSEKK